MDRRAFVSSLALGVLAAPLAAGAQPVGKLYRIGFLSGAQPRSAAHVVAFVDELAKLGYAEGKNLAFEFRDAEGQVERMRALAAELVGLKVDLVVASGPEATLRAVRGATSTLPIVVAAVDYDPIALGYVASLARPGGNITGVFFQQLELTAKRLELLKESLPGVSRVAVLWDAFSTDQWKAVQVTAQSLGVQVQSVELREPPYDFDRAFATAVRGGTKALLVLMSPVFFRDRARMADLAARNRLAAMFGLRAWAEAGGLMAYGANISDMFRRAAAYVDRIMKGAKPGDLPVEQPTKFEFVINAKTAKALGLTIPPSILSRADHVIE